MPKCRLILVRLHARYPPNCNQRHLGNVSSAYCDEPAHVGTVDGKAELDSTAANLERNLFCFEQMC